MSTPTAPSSKSLVDPLYEFDCPRYRNFDVPEDDDADTWFTPHSTPSQAGGKTSGGDIHEELLATMNHEALMMPPTEGEDATFEDTQTPIKQAKPRRHAIVPSRATPVAVAQQQEEEETEIAQPEEPMAQSTLAVVQEEATNVSSSIVAELSGPSPSREFDSITSMIATPHIPSSQRRTRKCPRSSSIRIFESEVTAEGKEQVVMSSMEFQNEDATPGSSPNQSPNQSVNCSMVAMNNTTNNGNNNCQEIIITEVQIENVPTINNNNNNNNNNLNNLQINQQHNQHNNSSFLSSHNPSVNSSINLSLNVVGDEDLLKTGEEEAMLEPTDDINLSAISGSTSANTSTSSLNKHMLALESDFTQRRGSLVMAGGFDMMMNKRSSLPMAMCMMPSSSSSLITTATNPTPSKDTVRALTQASVAHDTSRELTHAALITDAHVEVLEKELMQLPEPVNEEQEEEQLEEKKLDDTEELVQNQQDEDVEMAFDQEVAQVNAPPQASMTASIPITIAAPIKQQQVEVDSPSNPKALLQQFSDVASTPNTNEISIITESGEQPLVHEECGKVTKINAFQLEQLPSAAMTKNKLPRFLQPTQAALAKVAKGKSVAASVASHGPTISSTVAASMTRRSTLAPPSVIHSTMKQASFTPKHARKRTAQEWLDENARPKTAVKKPQEKHEEMAAGVTRKTIVPTRSASGVTVGVSPALSTRVRAKSIAHAHTVISSEEALLNKIQSERDQLLKEKAKRSEELAAVAGTVPFVPQRTAQLTQPEEFIFHTAKRAKLVTITPAIGIVAEQKEVVSRPSTAASNHAVVNTVEAPVTVTKPVPFSFHTASRLSQRKSSVRPVVQSQDSLDEAMMSRMVPFKARPLNRDIFTSGGEMGVPRVQKQKVTEAKSPMLQTKERGEKRKQEEEDVAPTASAAAAASSISSASSTSTSSTSIFTSSVQQKSAKKQRVGAPHLATEERGRLAQEEFERKKAEAEREAEMARVFQARPLIGATNGLASLSSAIPPITPGRSGFHSRSVSICSTSSISSSASTSSVTIPITPSCVSNHLVARAKLEAAVSTQLASESAQREFHARPIVHGSGPIEVKKSDRPLTQPKEIHFASDARADQRNRWEAAIAADLAKAEADAAAAKAEAEAKKARELKEYRAKLVLRAHPVPQAILQPALPIAKHSTAKLTQPESPMLVTKRRATMKVAQVVPQTQQVTAMQMTTLLEENPEMVDENGVPIDQRETTSVRL